MTDPLNLKKINDNLIHEVRVDGRPFDWRREFERAELRLADARVDHILSAEFAGIRPWQKATSIRNIQTLRATGKLHGSITALDESLQKTGTFRDVDVQLYPVSEADWETRITELSEESGPNFSVQFFGTLHHATQPSDLDEMEAPYISICLYIQERELYQFLRNLTETRQSPITEINLDFFAPFFRSEVDRALESPYHSKDFFIESGKSLPAYLGSVAIKSGPQDLDTTENDENFEARETIQYNGIASAKIQHNNLLIDKLQKLYNLLLFCVILLAICAVRLIFLGA